jgi:hypothetical protein
MPRSSSQSRSSSYKPSRPALPTPPPAVFRNPYSSVGHPTPIVNQPTLGQSMKEGFGLGAGSAIAHRVVASIFGAPTVNTVITTTPQSVSVSKQPCDKERLAFEACMKTQSMETFCGQEQLAYTSCIRVEGPK